MNISPRKRVACLSLIASVWIAAMSFQPFWPVLQPSVLAQADNGIRMAAQAGFDGLCKDGGWVPVKVSVENRGESQEASLEIRTAGLNTPEALYTQPISLPSGSHKETFLYFHLDAYQAEITVQLVANRQVLGQAAAPINCLAANDRIFGVISANPSNFNLLADLDPVNGKSSVARLAMDDLPDRAPAWEVLDYLILSDADTGALTARQVEALDGWMAAGGTLIVTGGPNWQASAAGIDRLLPYHPDHTQTVDSLLGQPGEAILSSGALAPGAEVIIDQDGAPLVIRSRRGAGSSIYLAADPSLQPLKNWDGMLSFYEQIVNVKDNPPGWANGIQAWDPAANAISALPELALPPFNLLCSFLALYVIAIGPANYLLLRKLKRKELAWISIPILVATFSLLAFIIGSRGRGKEPVISRIAMIQVWPDTEQASVTGLVGIFSPNRASYNLAIDRNFLAHPLPEHPNMVPAGGWVFETMPDDRTRIPDLRVDIAGIDGLALVGQTTAPDIQNELTLQLASQGVSFVGELHNRSDLALQGAVILYPGGAWQVGDFKPGDNRSFQIDLSDQEKASYQPPDPQTVQSAASSYLPPYPYNSSDSLATYLLGSGDTYRDQEVYRRYNLLNSLVSYTSPGVGSGGIYLAGWSSESPLGLQLEGQRFRSSDTSLYLIALNATISRADSAVALPPGLFTWSILEASAGYYNPTPYDSYLEGGEFSIQYKLNQPIPYTGVKQLTLHLKSYDSQGPTGFNQYLWDFDQATWVALENVDWGDTHIPDPERYVGAGGEIRLRLESSSGYLSIERADFSLEVEP